MQDYEIPMVLIGKHVAETTHDDLAAERAARQAEVLRVAWRRSIGHQPMPTGEKVA